VVFVGLCLGAATFLSTEQGIAAFIAFAIVCAIGALRAVGRRQRVGDAGATIGLGFATFLFLVFVVAGRGTLGVLRYNFRSVPMDQYWYFGAPPSVFISSWSALPGMLWHAWPVGLAIVLGVVLLVIRLRAVARATDDDSARQAGALALLSTYGIV